MSYLNLAVNYSQNAKKALEGLASHSSENMEDVSDKVRAALQEKPEEDSTILKFEVSRYKGVSPVTVKAEHVHGNYSIYVSLLHHTTDKAETIEL